MNCFIQSLCNDGMELVPVAGQWLIRGQLRMQMLIDGSLLRVYFESQNSFGMHWDALLGYLFVKMRVNDINYSRKTALS